MKQEPNPQTSIRSHAPSLTRHARMFSMLVLMLSTTSALLAQVTLTGLSPNVGSTTASTMVLVTGTHFSTGMTVWFGSQQAPIVNYTGPNAVYVMVPPQPASAVQVDAIESPTDRASLGYAFSYAATSTVTLSAVQPTIADASTTPQVTLAGQNFVAGSQVKVNNAPAIAVSVVSPTQIKATLPALSPGSYTVEVVTPSNAVGSLPNGFSYAAAVKVVTATLAAATVGQPYSASAEATGGTPPYTWSITKGSLPPGLTGTAQGKVSGAPTTTGTYNYTVQVSDSEGAKASSSGALTVQPASKKSKNAPTGTALSKCEAITSSGSYYLANNVTCTTQGFAFNANNITLDLNGNTITYGNPSTVAPAISICDQWYSSLPTSACGNGQHAAPVIKNGTITQAGNSAPFTHAIWIGQANGLSGGTIQDVTINIQAVGTEAIFGDYPGVGWTIEDNTINDKVTNIQHSGQIPLSARSQFQGVAIKLNNGDNPGSGDLITGNTINGSPQGGIFDSNQNTRITNNVITLSSLYSNDYGVTVLSNGQVVSGNVINGRGRGIDAESSNFTVSGNTINVHEEANNSEYGGCELRGSDGIRIKNYAGQPVSTGWTVENNNVTVEATYCEAHGLRFSDLGNTVKGTVEKNSFTTNGTQGDYALSFSGFDQSAITYESNAFSGSTCAQIDNDGTTDGANASIQAGQTWACKVQAVFDNDLTAGGDGSYPIRLSLGDVPSNHTVTCGGYAKGLIKLGSSVTKQCEQ